MKLPEKAKEAFSIFEAAKFLATKDENNVPNIAMIATLRPWGDDELIFGTFLMWQTEKNLRNGSPVTASVMTSKFDSYQVKGEFLGFETQGEKFDTLSNLDLFRYSAIGLLRSVGTIAVKEVKPLNLSLLSVAREWMSTKLGGKRPNDFPEGKKANPIVVKNTSVLMGAKYLTFIRDNKLEQFPVLGMRPAGDYLAIRADLPLEIGENVAVSSFNLGLKAYQFKGTYQGVKKTRGFNLGYIKIDKILSQTPPLVSKEVPSDNFI
jgi:hypothetical protein